MNRESDHMREIDDLLKQVLKDDLPAELESKMRMQFADVRESIEQRIGPRLQHRGHITGRLFAVSEWLWPQILFSREVLAMLSIFLVLSGAAMQLSGHHSILADSLSLLKRSISVAAQIRQAESMVCTVRIRSEQGGSSLYVIRWISSGRTRIDFTERGGSHKVRWISSAVITIADTAAGMRRVSGDALRPEDSWLQPVRDLLSPDQLATNMDGKWQLERHERGAEEGLGSFLFNNPRSKARLEVTADMRTLLPVRIVEFLPAGGKAGSDREIIRQAIFSWNQPIDPGVMAPGNSSGIVGN